MAGLVDERKAVDIYSDFSKAFGIVSHKIPLEKIMEVWAGWGNSEVDWKLCEQLGPRNAAQWHKVSLEASNLGCPPGVNTGSDYV